MKIWDIFRSASANLLRNKSRTILTIIAIFIGAFTISLTVGINIGVNDYVDKQLNSLGDANQMFITPKREMTGFPGAESEGPQVYQEGAKSNDEQNYLSKDDLKKLKDTKGLTKVKAFETYTTEFIQSQDSKKYVIQAQPDTGVKLELSAGKQVDNDTDSYEMDLAPEFVKALGFKNAKAAVGKEITLGVAQMASGKQELVKVKVVGVREDSIIQGGTSLTNQSLSKKLTAINQEGLPDSMKNKVPMATALVDSSYTAKEVTDLKNRLSDAGFEAQTIEDSIGTVKSVINGITGVLTMFGGIALLAASFGIINTLYMSVQERTREIGLMKAMGMSGGKIFTLFSVEALLIGFWGSVIGVLGAMGAGQLINNFAADSFLKNLDGLTLIEFSVQPVIMIILLIMLIAFLAGTFPAKRAAKLDPITALRYE
ncbi:permease [Vagococcus penaei]|uniref:Permease n=1 Tax=Vagococcus penaei TaxID=633807 RepID=A0A1Q2D7B8_9ENTE|nr:ABC transporter permease [Vagococcus penaei]AQP54220.1 permease [Vagococcus penaei]RSU00005.1 permease [Vagococcus penaei]